MSLKRVIQYHQGILDKYFHFNYHMSTIKAFAYNKMWQILINYTYKLLFTYTYCMEQPHYF